MRTPPSPIRPSTESDNGSRRHFLRGVVSAGTSACCLATMSGTASALQPPANVADDELVLPLTKSARDAMNPDQIIARAMAGNRRFRDGTRKYRNVLAELKQTAGGQNPAAVMLACIDSRAASEIIFDLGLGDIFNCRVAGNVENPDILGSIEFATKLAGAKVVAVVGHSACGAVQGAIAGAELGNLTQLLAKIRPAIDETDYDGERTAENPEFVDAVARKNVELTIGRIRKNSPVIAGLAQSGAVKILGGFFDLATGEVDFFV